jgi:hypothetical protein
MMSQGDIAVFPIVPARSAALFVVLAAVAIPLALALWHVWRASGSPPAARVVVTAVSVLVAVLVGGSLYGSRRSRVEIGPDTVRLRGDLYGRTIAMSQVRAAAARVVDLDAEPGLRPILRTNGVGLPGYQAGWFRLADGSRALLYLTDRRRAVHVPTTLGYVLLLSAAEPEGLVGALRAASPATPRAQGAAHLSPDGEVR